MEENKLEDFIIGLDSSIIECMKKIDQNHNKILFVVDKVSRIIGSVTDGDIRRSVLAGEKLDNSITNSFNVNPVKVERNYDILSIKRIMLEKKIECVPVVNENDKIIELLFWNQLFGEPVVDEHKKQINASVVIMAGGVGKRLEPFTQVLPKPLIPIGDKTIIELIMDMFRSYGINEYHITINHKANIIKFYLKELKNNDILHFITEGSPLGTAGSLKHLEGAIHESFFITNCDIIIYADYADIYDFHRNNHFCLTLVSSMMNFQIPYGTCEIDKGGELLEIKEKPEYNFLISTGLYIMEPYALKYIPDNSLFHMTHLIEAIKKDGGKIGVYPISDKSWSDTGQWAEYRKTVNRLNNDK